MASELASASTFSGTTPRSSPRRNTLLEQRQQHIRGNSISSTANTAIMGGSIRPQSFKHAKQLVKANPQPQQQQQPQKGDGSSYISGSDVDSSSYIGSIYSLSGKEKERQADLDLKDAILQPTDSTEGDVGTTSNSNRHALAYTAATTTSKSHHNHHHHHSLEEEKKDGSPFPVYPKQQQQPSQQNGGHPQQQSHYQTHRYPIQNNNNNRNRPAVIAEMSPMMRMRHPTLSQQPQNLASRSSSSETTPPHIDATSSVSVSSGSHHQNYKTEEQVRAEKQKKWKRKMKLAQQQRQQEQASLGEDDDFYRADDDCYQADDDYDDDDTTRDQNSIVMDNHNNKTKTRSSSRRSRLLHPSWSAVSGDTGDTGGTSCYDESSELDFDDDERTTTHEDDIRFTGCQPGTNLKLDLHHLTMDNLELGLGEIWSSLTLSKTSSSMGSSEQQQQQRSSSRAKAKQMARARMNRAAATGTSKSTRTTNNKADVRYTFEEVTKHPAELLSKLIDTRCGIDLEDMSLYEDEDYSFSDYEDNDDDDVDSRGGRRGRSRRPRSKSPSTNSASNRHLSRDSRVSTTSRQTETSVGEILDDPNQKNNEVVVKGVGDPDGTKHDETRSQPSYQQQRPSKSNFSVVSGGSSKTPQAGTKGNTATMTNLLKPQKMDGSIHDVTQVYEMDDSEKTAPGSAVGSILSESGSRVTGMSKASASASVMSKTVSFDESTICKPSLTELIPTVASLDKADPNFIKLFVAGLNHHGTPLLWHRSPAEGSDSNYSRDADSVMAYLKLDSTKNNPAGAVATSEDGFEVMTATSASAKNRAPPMTWDSPRLVWFNETISSGGIEQKEMGAIDLFDIVSVETDANQSAAFAKTLKAHPLSQPSRTIVIRLSPNAKTNMEGSSTQNGFVFPSAPAASVPKTVVLEATSEDAAKTLVLGLKWMVARLTFNLVVGNLSISCELLQPAQQQQQHQPKQEEKHLQEGRSALTSCTSGDDESMGPLNVRLPIIRRTKVMNDMTFHMTDICFERSTMHSISQADIIPKTTSRRTRPSTSQDPPGSFV